MTTNSDEFLEKEAEKIAYGLWNTAWADGFNKDKSAREQSAQSAADRIKSLVQRREVEARIDEGEKIEFDEFRGLLFWSEDEYGNPIQCNRVERREYLEAKGDTND